MFHVEKKSQYALTIWDNDRERGAPSYLYHEHDVEIFTSKGFSESQLIAAQEANVAVQKVVALNAERHSINSLNGPSKEFEDAVMPTRVNILEFMLRCIKDGENYHPGSFMLKRYVEEVQLKLLPDRDLHNYAAWLENNLWR